MSQQILTGAVGALVGAFGWLLVGLYIQRRQFGRDSKNAGRAVHFELAVNEANVEVAIEHAVFQPLASASFDRLLPELATWLPAEEVQTVVQAYASHAGYEQAQRDTAVSDSVRREVLQRVLDVHRAASLALRRRSFDAYELRRMGLGDAAAGPQPPSGAARTEWRDALDRYFDIFSTHDLSGLDEILADDFSEEYPQSGEVFRGRDRYLEMLNRYPGGPGRLHDGATQVHGGEEGWALSPTFSLLRISGGDGSYTATGLGHYPDGTDWHIVKLIELAGGKITKVTSYYAPQFPAPGWRADLTEP